VNFNETLIAGNLALFVSLSAINEYIIRIYRKYRGKRKYEKC
jgi:hypothetical protein